MNKLNQMKAYLSFLLSLAALIVLALASPLFAAHVTSEPHPAVPYPTFEEAPELYRLESATWIVTPIENSANSQPLAPTIIPELTSDGDLANIGKTLWDLLVGNERPHSVDWNKIKAHALPVGVQSPIELSAWNGTPKSQSFEVRLVNAVGMDLFKLVPQVAFNWGGKYRGQGQHIANATVIPTAASAFISIRGDSVVRVLDPLYAAQRVAVLPLVIETKISGPLDTVVKSQRFDLRGDGQLISHQVEEMEF